MCRTDFNTAAAAYAGTGFECRIAYEKQTRSLIYESRHHSAERRRRLSDNSEYCRSYIIGCTACSMNFFRRCKPYSAFKRFFKIYNVMRIISDNRRTFPVERSDIVRRGKKSEIYRITVSGTARTFHADNRIHHRILRSCGNIEIDEK